MIRTITVTCDTCQGTGFIHSTERMGRRYYDIAIPCSTCNMAGTESVELPCCHICGEYECMGECQEITEPATAPVVVNGGEIDAPGFTTFTFLRGVEKARGRYMQMVPMRDGSLRVDTGRAGHVYFVTRTRCSCLGHRSHGHCYHRSAAIAASDLWGIDLRHHELVGFDETGRPITKEERERQLVAA